MKARIRSKRNIIPAMMRKRIDVPICRLRPHGARMNTTDRRRHRGHHVLEQVLDGVCVEIGDGERTGVCMVPFMEVAVHKGEVEDAVGDVEEELGDESGEDEFPD